MIDDRLLRALLCTWFLLVHTGFSRKDLPPPLFTTTVLKVNRANGQIILKVSPAGQPLLKEGNRLVLSNYDAPKATLQVTIKKTHPKKPQIIVQVDQGAYKEIEKGFKYSTRLEVATPVNPTPPTTPKS